MKKEKKKVSKKVKLISFLIVGILTLLIVRFRYNLDWIYSIGITNRVNGDSIYDRLFKKRR